jgi:enolase
MMYLRRLLSTTAKKSSKGLTIQDIRAREIIDSRGNPTVEADIKTELGLFRAAVPSGASTGVYEALELRDKKDPRYGGKGVATAVKNVNEIIRPALLNKSVLDQGPIDRLMVEVLDGSKNEWGFSKSKLGANAILGVSLALARAGAAYKKVPLYKYIAEIANTKEKKFILPVPSLNIVNGGSHAGNKINFQEFMIMPVGAKSFKEAMQMACEVYASLQKKLKDKYGKSSVLVGDEGGFGAPQLNSEEEVLEFICQSINQAGYENKVKIAMDVAASEFYGDDDRMYDMGWKTKEAGKKITGEELMNKYKQLVEKYPIISIEDPFEQNAFDTYTLMNKEIGHKVQIVGDDLLVTNPTRIKVGIEKKSCNALLLKVNQIGSLTESIDACKMSRKAGWGVMVSHRSGETEDSFIADLVVGLGTGQIKTGAPCRSDRVAKYNQLLRIEEELGDKAVYAGLEFKNPSKLFE